VKLLFDQNISYRILKLIEQTFPESKQVRELQLEDKPDKEIWKYAGQNGFIIITFDADFYELSNLYGHPPKIIWLRSGNNTTLSVSQIILSKKELIADFFKQDEFSCLEIQ